MLEGKTKFIDEALACIDEDDLDSLKELVPKVVPIDLRIKEF